MKLSKALKVKNRLAGEVSRLMEVLRRENSRRNDNPSTVNVEEVFSSLNKTRSELLEIKSRIAVANVGAYGYISEISELKTFINFLKGVPNKKGEQVEFQGMQREKLTYVWTAFLDQEKIDKLVIELQERINALQDSVDEYNAVTDI